MSLSKVVTGRYHNFTRGEDLDLPTGFSRRQTSFDLNSVGVGDPFGESTYAEDPFEPIEESSAELPACVSLFRDITTSGTVRHRWVDTDADETIFTLSERIPDPSDEDLERWAVFTVFSWVGRFPGEIDSPGNYAVEVTSSFGNQTVDFTVTDTTDDEPEPDADPTTFSITLPSLPLVNNDPRDLATLTIPQISDIEAIVASAVPSLSDIRAEISAELTRQLTQLEESIVAEIEDIDISGITEITETLEELEANLSDLNVPTVDEIANAIEFPLEEIRNQIGSVIAAIDETIDDLQEAIENRLDDIDDAITEVQDGITSVSDDLTNFIDTFPDTVQERAVDALEEAEPTFDGSGLFSDPIGFAQGFVAAASDEIVDPKVRQDLQDRLEDE